MTYLLIVFLALLIVPPWVVVLFRKSRETILKDEMKRLEEELVKASKKVLQEEMKLEYLEWLHETAGKKAKEMFSKFFTLERDTLIKMYEEIITEKDKHLSRLTQILTK